MRRRHEKENEGRPPPPRVEDSRWTLHVYIHVQGSAKEWSLGCVIPASWLPLAAGVGFTQPRDHSLADRFTSVCVYSLSFVPRDAEDDGEGRREQNAAGYVDIPQIPATSHEPFPPITAAFGDAFPPLFHR